MERERERQRVRRPAAPAPGPELEAPRDTAALAREARKRLAAVDAENAGIAVNVRTTTSPTANAVRLVATPDTPVGEIMEHACQELGLQDRARYNLVVGPPFEVLMDGQRRLGEIVGEGVKTELSMRLVRKPEAGRPALLP